MSKPQHLSLQQNNRQNKPTATKMNAKMKMKMNIHPDEPLQPAIDWDSERQLLSSLAKLQELESKIYTLRTLLPNRLLAPINPVINDHQKFNNSLPPNPQELNTRLTKAATSGVAEIAEFRELWQSPEAHAIWARFVHKMRESKGAFPQPSGMWERDYAELLKEYDAEERNSGKNGGDGNNNNNKEGSAEGGDQGDVSDAAGWKAIVESFQQRQLPHFRIATSKTSSSVLLVHLGLAGITFELEQAAAAVATSSTPDNNGSTPEWRVSTHSSSSRPVSRLETDIVQQLNARKKKWDLRYLLEMIIAYADIRRAPCKKCNMMTDSQAQLPVVRRAVDFEVVGDGNNMNEGKGVVWEAYHIGCA